MIETQMKELKIVNMPPRIVIRLWRLMLTPGRFSSNRRMFGVVQWASAYKNSFSTMRASVLLAPNKPVKKAIAVLFVDSRVWCFVTGSHSHERRKGYQIKRDTW